MGRRTVFDMLPAARRAQAIAIAHANRHASLSDLKAILAEEMGLEISRSAIHRNLKRSSATAPVIGAPSEGSIVTIMDRTTGEVRIVKTALLVAEVADLIHQSGPTAEFHPL